MLLYRTFMYSILMVAQDAELEMCWVKKVDRHLMMWASIS